MVNATISLVGSNGDTIELSDSGDYVLTTGVFGFGIPTTQVRIGPSATDGGVWRHTKRGVRDLDLPIAVLGSSETDVQTKLRRLNRLLQTTLGPTRVVVTYEDGESLYLEAHYVGGAETQFGEDANSFFCKWVIQMQAPQPFWTQTALQSFSVSSGGAGRGLLPQLTKLKFTSDTALGDITVTNEGDVVAYPLWQISGPIANLEVSNGTQSFTLPNLIPTGITVFVDSATGRVYNNAGDNLYNLLGPAPKFFGFNPGESVVTITGTDYDTNMLIGCFYSLLYEVVH